MIAIALYNYLSWVILPILAMIVANLVMNKVKAVFPIFEVQFATYTLLKLVAPFVRFTKPFLFKAIRYSSIGTRMMYSKLPEITNKRVSKIIELGKQLTKLCSFVFLATVFLECMLFLTLFFVVRNDPRDSIDLRIKKGKKVRKACAKEGLYSFLPSKNQSYLDWCFSNVLLNQELKAAAILYGNLLVPFTEVWKQKTCRRVQ